MKSAMAFLVLLFVPTIGFAQDAKPALGASKMSEAPASRIAMEEMYVPAKDPGIKIYVRNKHLASISHFSQEKTVLFVHGATYPAETSFDLELNGLSWMDYIAQRGYDVYLMDVRGYGRSTRPPEMDAPPEQNAPIADTETAVAGYQRGGGPHSRAAQAAKTRADRMVLGHFDHGHLHGGQQ